MAAKVSRKGAMVNGKAQRFFVGLFAVTAACGPAARPVPPLPPSDDASVALSAQPKVVWQTDTGYGITAPLVVRGEAVFATTTNRTVVAINRETGRRYWLQRFDGAISTGVALAGGQVFFATEDTRGEAWAIDAVRGRRVWKRRIGSARVRPLVVSETVVFGVQDGSVYALRALDGAVAWRTRLPGSVTLDPTFAAGSIITATTADSAFALDPATGRIQKRVLLPGTPAGPALLAAGSLIFPTNEAGVISLNAVSFQIEARAEVGAPVLAQPQLSGGNVYVLNREGEVWRIGGQPARIAALGGAAREAFTVAGDQLVAGLLDGRVIGIDSGGKTLWQFRAERSASAPLVARRDALFVPLLNGELLKLQ